MRRPSSTARKPAVPTVASLASSTKRKSSAAALSSTTLAQEVEYDRWIEEGDPLDILEQRRAAALTGKPMPSSRKLRERPDEDPLLSKRPVHLEHPVSNDDDGEEKGFMANKPWLGAIYPPSTYIKDPNNPHEVFNEEHNNWSAPNVTLELDYVFGYRARDCRNNVHWVGNNRIVFPAAAIGVVLNVDTKKEFFFNQHNDDIMCMDYHGGKNLVASGSLGSQFNAQLCLWSVGENSCDTKHIITGFHQFAVVSVAFNPQGTMVASVGLDEHHSIALFCTETGLLLANAVCDKSRVVHCLANTSSLVNSELCFVTIGVKHISFFEPAKDVPTKKNFYAITDEPVEQRMVGTRGTGCKDIDSIAFLSLCFTSEHCVAGASNGMAYFFHAKRKNVELVVKVGEDSPRLLSMANIVKGPDANSVDKISIGTSDGEVLFFNVYYQGRDQFNTGDLACEPDASATADGNLLQLNLLDDATNNNKDHMVASCRSLCWNPATQQLLVGTILSHIYTIHTKGSTKEEVLFKGLVGGHWGNLKNEEGYGEIWGLDVHPTEQKIITCSDDATVRMWDLQECKEIARDFVDYPAMKCSFSLDGTMVAVGHRNGGFQVLASDLDTKIMPFRRERTQRVCDIAFSPNSKFLAVCAEYVVDVYRVDPKKNPTTGEVIPGKDFTKIGVCKGHTSKVSAMDWSIGSSLIQVSSVGYDLLYFDVPTCDRLTGVRALADQIWFTQTCTIGWSVQGIWPRYSDGTDINAVAKSRSDQYLVTTDDWGKVMLFNYPCIGSGLDRKNGMLRVRPEAHTYTGHASHVTNCVWTCDDSYLCTTGGQDLCVMSWKVNFSNAPRPKHFLDAAFIARHERRTAQDSEAKAAAAALPSQPAKDAGGEILTNCYLCDFDYPDAVMQTCPICFAPRKAVAQNLRRAWVDKATSRFRLPTSSFANYARNQIKFRKEMDAKEKVDNPFVPMGRIVAYVRDDEASNSEDEETTTRGRVAKPISGVTRMGTHVNIEKPKKKTPGPPKRKTTGPDFRDF